MWQGDDYNQPTIAKGGTNHCKAVRRNQEVSKMAMTKTNIWSISLLNLAWPHISLK